MAKEFRKGRRRLSVDIPATLFFALQEEATRRHVTVTKFVIKALLEKVHNTSTFQ